ncbi:MAG: TetR/AcrR family transcriptional regulator [Planctomycetota bacterium]|jgi:AcrR family transcriptional regulator
MTSNSTKDRILDAAERLFADQGFKSTSMRNITQEADVNLAAVNYHFGSKLALFTAVLARRINPVNEERIARLDAIEKETPEGPLDLEAVLRAFLEPILQMSRLFEDQGRGLLMLARRAHTDQNPEVRTALTGLFEQVFHRFHQAFQRALPEVPPQELALKMFYVVGSMIQTMAWSHRPHWLDKGEVRPLEFDDVTEGLIRFAVAGMRAPLGRAVEGGGP